MFKSCPPSSLSEIGNTTSLETTRVSWAPLAADDDFDLRSSLNITCFPKSGSIFHIGNTRVGCVASDSLNNEGRCVFDVQIEEGKQNVIHIVTNILEVTLLKGRIPFR